MTFNNFEADPPSIVVAFHGYHALHVVFGEVVELHRSCTSGIRCRYAPRALSITSGRRLACLIRRRPPTSGFLGWFSHSARPAGCRLLLPVHQSAEQLVLPLDTFLLAQLARLTGLLNAL